MQKIINIIVISLVALAFVTIYKRDKRRFEGLVWHDQAVKNITQFLMISYEK